MRKLCVGRFHPSLFSAIGKLLQFGIKISITFILNLVLTPAGTNQDAVESKYEVLRSRPVESLSADGD